MMERLTEYEQDEFDGTIIAVPKYERTQMGDADLKEWAYRAAAELANYEDVDEQGRMIKLPFTIGENFYQIFIHKDGRKEIAEWEVDGYSYSNGNLYIHTEEEGIWFDCDRVDGDIFGTREEAEAKLARIEGIHE